jgi:hypothetical protein
VGFLEDNDIDGLVICGVELVCCVLYAVLGAAERGYHYVVPQDLMSGQDPGDESDNKAVRDYLRFNQPGHAIESSDEILIRWRGRSREWRERTGNSARSGRQRAWPVPADGEPGRFHRNRLSLQAGRPCSATRRVMSASGCGHAATLGARYDTPCHQMATQVDAYTNSKIVCLNDMTEHRSGEFR